ncbi:hypothetical protein C6A37_07155, partial [Desulfobacteraceae bacterium SEEP-SAG9]
GQAPGETCSIFKALQKRGKVNVEKTAKKLFEMMALTQERDRFYGIDRTTVDDDFEDFELDPDDFLYQYKFATRH